MEVVEKRDVGVCGWRRTATNLAGSDSLSFSFFLSLSLSLSLSFFLFLYLFLFLSHCLVLARVTHGLMATIKSAPHHCTSPVRHALLGGTLHKALIITGNY